METNILKIISVVFICTIVYGCTKDQHKPDQLANRTYEWKITLPYLYSYNYSAIGTSFLNDGIHTDWEYDSLTHYMFAQFAENHSVNFVERFVAHYSSAYRYIGTSDTAIFMLHPEEWQKYDTSYIVEKEKSTAAKYDYDHPKISFTLNAIYINIQSGPKPDFDYNFIRWDNKFSYTGTFLSDNVLECHFPVEWNGDVDTLTRQFIL